MTEADAVAVVTGAASGIGQGLAREALARGMRVVLADIDQAGLDATAKTLGGDVLVVPTDVADGAAVERLAQQAYKHFGRVDLLFNNAGILSGGLTWEVSPERWAKVLGINVMGVVHGVASFVPRMIAAGRPARVINTASIGGFLSSPFIAPYTASKFAVVALTEALAVELQLAGTSVAVSLLAPGAVRTEIYAETRTRTGKDVVARTLGKMRDYTEGTGISPDELAKWAFAGIDKGAFWLIMQPQLWNDAILARAEHIVDGVNPSSEHYNVTVTDSRS